MKEILVNHDCINYRVYIDNTMDKFHGLLDEYKIKNSDKIFVITDDIVFNIYGDNIHRLLDGYKYHVFYFNNGEKSKNINTLLGIYDFLINNCADANSVIIAIGGGVVCDLASYAASSFMRGIKFISIPTTLISQIDSCIGGKNGFDYKGLKDIIGSFYSPKFVYVSINFLKSLSKEHFINGLVRAIKYGIIKDKLLLHYVNDNIPQLMEKENDRLSFLVRECLNIKAGIIKDECRGSEFGNILSFGSIIGSAIESDANNTILHGNAEALGILAAIKLSELKVGLPNDVYTSIEKLYKKLKLPTCYKVDNFSSFLYAISHDNRNAGDIRLVLLEQLEKCKIKVAVNEDEITRALKLSICRGN